LIPGASQEAAAIIATKIVSMRGNCAAVIGDIRTCIASFQDGVSNFQCLGVEDTSPDGGRVTAKGAVSYHKRSDVEDAATFPGRVAADSAVGDD
jgi:hypothetical protein